MKPTRIITYLFRIILSLILVAVVMHVPDFTSIMNPETGGVVLAFSYLAKIADDPQLWKKWGVIAQKQGELKTEFTESEIGVTWGDDGPEQSQQVPAAPIKLVEDLTAGGKFIDVPIDNPLYKEPEDILVAGRYGEQDRIGAEETLTRHNFRVLLDKWHLGIAEKEVEESIPNTAHMTPARFMQRMVEAWTDHVAQRKDYGTYFAAFAGADIHHYINAAERGGLSNGANLIADPGMGLMSSPREHRRSFVWNRNGTDDANQLEVVAHNADVDTYEANIVLGLDKITAAATPTLDMLRKINRECINSAMIPSTLRNPDGKARHYYLVLIPGNVRDLLEKDTEFKSVMESAYQSIVEKHPLLQPGDVVYKNLIIRDSAKLDKDYFSAKSSFNAITSDTSETTAMAFTKATVSGVEKLGLTVGTRSFTAASEAATAFGSATATNLVGRILVLGGAGIVRATGPNFELKKLEVTEYGLKDGIGRTQLFGQVRNEKWTVNNAYESTPQSFQVFCLQDG